MASRIVIEEPCHICGQFEEHDLWCSARGVKRRVLTEGEYVLIEKVDGEWPEWATYAARPFEVVRMDDGYNSLATRESTTILDALAGGEQP